MSIRELHKRFRRYCRIEEGLSPKTVDGLKAAMTGFVNATGIEEIEALDVDGLREFFYEGEERKEWSYWTYVYYHKYLKKFFGWCVKHDYLAENPLLAIGKPKKPQRLPRRLSLLEAQRLLYAAMSHAWSYPSLLPLKPIMAGVM